jgi:hypothetical protein
MRCGKHASVTNYVEGVVDTSDHYVSVLLTINAKKCIAGVFDAGEQFVPSVKNHTSYLSS